MFFFQYSRIFSVPHVSLHIWGTNFSLLCYPFYHFGFYQTFSYYLLTTNVSSSISFFLFLFVFLPDVLLVFPPQTSFISDVFVFVFLFLFSFRHSYFFQISYSVPELLIVRVVFFI